jgi:hypothetical protein
MAIPARSPSFRRRCGPRKAASSEPFLTTCRLFSRRSCCSSLEHLPNDCCASRKPGSSSDGTTRRRTESSIGNADPSLFRPKPLVRAFSSEPVPFELSQSDGGCNAQIACYRDSVARHCFRVIAGCRPRRGRGIGQRTFEIFQPGRVDASGPNRQARALRDYGIFFVVGEKPTALAPAI